MKAFVHRSVHTFVHSWDRDDYVVMTSVSVAWPVIAARLAPERSYWLATTTRDGAPHVAPVWGAVLDEVCYFYSERSTVKARNLAADQRVAVHLSDGEDVVIVRGSVVDLGHPARRPEVLDAFAAKYARPGDREFLPSADPAFDVLYALEPRSALLWELEDYEGSQRRWQRSS